jgi:methyltransferase
VIAPLYWILALVAAQRIAEAIYAERNTRALLRRGAVERAAIQYPFFVALHVAWLLSMLLLVPSSVPPNWYLVAVYALLQAVRYWILRTLGPRWTTRIIVLPNAPLVRSGPYRFMRHPNYAVVVLEIALLPCAFHAYAVAGLFTVLNAFLIGWRVRAEKAALATA